MRGEKRDLLMWFICTIDENLILSEFEINHKRGGGDQRNHKEGTMW